LGDPIRTVAVLVANPALSSILSVTLAGASSLRVRPFDSQLALTTYLHLAPVDLIVADFDSASARADHLAEDLHADDKLERRDFQLIALASELTVETKAASIHAGIDEIIMKPMSPRYLVERVLARLAKQPSGAKPLKPAERRGARQDDGWSRFGDNVVPLFRAPEAQH
jgi:response regulator RpfG family c-di-GMP phosphodiesterase